MIRPKCKSQQIWLPLLLINTQDLITSTARILVQVNIISCLDYCNSLLTGFSASGFTPHYSPHNSQTDPFKSDSVHPVITSLQALPAHLYTGLEAFQNWWPCLLPSSQDTRHQAHGLPSGPERNRHSLPQGLCSCPLQLKMFFPHGLLPHLSGLCSNVTVNLTT